MLGFIHKEIVILLAVFLRISGSVQNTKDENLLEKTTTFSKLIAQVIIFIIFFQSAKYSAFCIYFYA